MAEIKELESRVGKCSKSIEGLVEGLGEIILGKEDTIERLVAGILARGHILLEGLPGIGKTELVKGIATLCSIDFSRIQFTPDLLPGDITGNFILQETDKKREFVFQQGPIFANIILADEINRASPKTQSAMLEAMQECSVTVIGKTYSLPPQPFFVLATQNPIDLEGTYPLPEAQLDRFLMKVVMDYPPQEQEIEVLRLHHQGLDMHEIESLNLQGVATPEEVFSCIQQVHEITVEEALLNYITEIVRRTREAPRVILGGSPRASVALLTCGKAMAALRQRAFLVPDDVKFIAHPVLRHRLILRPEAELEGITPDRLIDSILAAVPVPQ